MAYAPSARGLNEFHLPPTGTPGPGPAILLAIDDLSWPFRKNVCLYLSKPKVRPEPVLAPSPLESNAPDNLAAHFYGTVLHEQGNFRMWYYACHLGRNPDWPPRMMQQSATNPAISSTLAYDSQIYTGPLCYAESDDGIHWEKPALGQVRFKGSAANNALALPHTLVSSPAVIRDDDDPDPARRYKMVYEFVPAFCDPKIEEFGSECSAALMVSADGLHWTLAGIPLRNHFVEHASFIKHAGAYIIHCHVFDVGVRRSEGAEPCGRSGIAYMSYDFHHWPDLWTETFVLPEPRDPRERGIFRSYDQVHLGVGAASFGNVCVGLYGLWHNAHFKEAFGDISCDLGLLISNDGLQFREPVKGHVFIHRDESPASPVPGRNYHTILCQANGLLNVGDTTYIYHGRWRNTGNTAEDEHLYRGEVALATLPRDRWGGLGLNPGVAEGVVCSAPVVLPAGGGELTINADGADGISVEVLDERLRAVPGFSGADAATPVGAGGLACPVRWPKSGLARLGGQTVRLQLRLRRRGSVEPRLYAAHLA
jgi:hypothetical protein